MSWALVAHTCNSSYSRGRDQEDQLLKPAWAKYPTENRAGGVAQEVDCQLTKHEIQSSNSSTTKRKKKVTLKYEWHASDYSL
jgi:hypothetical protein